MTSSSPARILGVHPLRGVPGGWVTLSGEGFPVDPPPDIRIGPQSARVLTASSRELRLAIPSSIDGGRTPVRLADVPGETVFLDVGSPLATGLHQVDGPVYDRHGNLFVTFSGSRGQHAPVSIYVVRPDGSREPFVTGLSNPTSMALDPAGRLHVSSRSEGVVYRIDDDGSAAAVAGDLGVACGIAFDRDGTLFVGDRSGTILRVEAGRATAFAPIPPSVAAFHLAFGPGGDLFVTAPTLSPRDSIYRVSPAGEVSIFHEGLGRPQGLAFDDQGRLHVVDALAGAGGLYRFGPEGGDPECLIQAGSLIGVAFGPAGHLAVCSSDTAYRLDVNISGLLPFSRQ